MPNEISLTAVLNVVAASQQAMSVITQGMLASMTGTRISRGSVLVTNTGQTAIPLGQITAPGWAYLKNLDATNYILIKNGTTGASVIQLLPGEAAFFRFFSTCVPYAAANNTACILEFLIAEN